MKLTEAELERLAVLSEECGEVVQIIGKIVRHGFESYHPDDVNQTTNSELLQKELGDIQNIVNMMSDADDINIIKIGEHCTKKNKTIFKYLKHNERPS